MKCLFDLVVVGHQTIDEIVSPREPVRRSPGGPVTFASLAATAMGRTVAIISRVGRDFPDEYVYWLSRGGVNLKWLHRDPESETTKFKITYGERMEERTLRLVARCSQIPPQDIPLNLEAKAVHLGPVAGEFGPELVRSARRICDLLAIDIQGCIREFEPNGETKLKELMNLDFIESVDVIKASENELMTVLHGTTLTGAKERLGLAEDKVLVVTRGGAGSTILKGSETIEIPAFPMELVRDPTGAGDAFMGVFISELAHGVSLKKSTAMGAAAASFVVEGIGPTSFGNREAVLERAKFILKHA